MWRTVVLLAAIAAVAVALDADNGQGSPESVTNACGTMKVTVVNENKYSVTRFDCPIPDYDNGEILNFDQCTNLGSENVYWDLWRSLIKSVSLSTFILNNEMYLRESFLTTNEWVVRRDCPIVNGDPDYSDCGGYVWIDLYSNIYYDNWRGWSSHMERLDTGEWREVQTAIHSDRIHGETRACTLDSDDGSTSYCTSWVEVVLNDNDVSDMGAATHVASGNSGESFLLHVQLHRNDVYSSMVCNMGQLREGEESEDACVWSDITADVNPADHYIGLGMTVVVTDPTCLATVSYVKASTAASSERAAVQVSLQEGFDIYYNEVGEPVLHQGSTETTRTPPVGRSSPVATIAVVCLGVAMVAGIAVIGAMVWRRRRQAARAAAAVVVSDTEGNDVTAPGAYAQLVEDDA